MDYINSLAGATFLDSTLKWTVLVLLTGGFMLSILKKPKRAPRFLLALGAVGAAMVLVSGNHLSRLQQQNAADAKARLEAEVVFTKRLAAQLKAAQLALDKARTKLKEVEEDVIDLQATLLDANDKLSRSGHRLAERKPAPLKSRPLKKAAYRTISTRLKMPSEPDANLGFARNDYQTNGMATH